MGLEDILGGILGGEPQESGQEGNPLGGLLEQLLGGGETASEDAGAANPLESILGGMSGQDAAASGLRGGGLMDIIGAILGGGMGGLGGGSESIVNGVASSTNLSSTIAQMIVAFVMSKLLGGAGSGGLGSLGGLLPGLAGATAGAPQAADSGEMDLDSLLEQMGSDESLVDELAAQTGLDAQTAKQGMHEALSRIGEQARGAQAPKEPKSGGLDSLLENW